MISVFKTNVSKKKDADRLIKELQIQFPFLRANFDLQDCDRILRVQVMEKNIPAVSDWLAQRGFQCKELF